MTMSTAPSSKGLCPLDGAPMSSEMLDEFHVCSRCREILYEAELVTVPTKEAQDEYLARTYPEGYDGTLVDFSASARVARWLKEVVAPRIRAFRWADPSLREAATTEEPEEEKP